MTTFSTGTPSVSGLYKVDRDKLGTAFRFYNAETGQWGRCGYDATEAMAWREAKTAVGEFPWQGPLKAPKVEANSNYQFSEVALAVAAKVEKAEKVKLVKTAGVKKGKSLDVVASGTKAPKAAAYADGTVFFRADRSKWVAMWNGKQEAARPTAEACLNFLKKKYSVDGVVIPQ